MWSPLTPPLRAEMERFRLVYCCEDCDHFRDEDGVCDLLYPTEPHRREAVSRAADGEPVLFCKMFEAR